MKTSLQYSSSHNLVLTVFHCIQRVITLLDCRTENHCVRVRTMCETLLRERRECGHMEETMYTDHHCREETDHWEQWRPGLTLLLYSQRNIQHTWEKSVDIGVSMHLPSKVIFSFYLWLKLNIWQKGNFHFSHKIPPLDDISELVVKTSWKIMPLFKRVYKRGESS